MNVLLAAVWLVSFAALLGGALLILFYDDERK